jgi:hypothetical protein
VWTWCTHTGGGKALAFKPPPNATRWCDNSWITTFPYHAAYTVIGLLYVLTRPPPAEWVLSVEVV